MSSAKPIKLITLDTETYNGLFGKLKRIAIYDGTKVTYGYTFEDILEELERLRKKFKLHIYIHNIEFDGKKIEWLWDNVNWNNCLKINGKFATIKCKEYTFHDSFKILPFSLSKLSKDFDVEHGKLDLWEEVQERYKDHYTDLVDFLDRCPVDDPLFLEYLGYDVMSLYEVLEAFINELGMDLKEFVNCPSTASISRYIFKNGYKGHEFKREGSDFTDYEEMTRYNWRYSELEENYIRAAYHGGRTEVFIPYLSHNGKHYDENSAYPANMRDREFPIGVPHFQQGVEARLTWKNWLKRHNGLGFLECEVFVPKQFIPPLPVKEQIRSKRDPNKVRTGRLYFPCGHLYGIWTYEELEFAVNHCGVEIEKIISCMHFVNTFPVFRRFVDVFYSMKEKAAKEGKKAKKAVAKLLLNTGYGYTGMRRDDKTTLCKIEDKEKHKSKGEKMIDLNPRLGYAEFTAEIKSEYIQPQVAAYVTSRARVALLKGLKAAETQGGNSYYCDTDSVVTDVPFPDEIIDPTKLGAWDLEGEPLEAIFLKPKVYAELTPEDQENTIKFKGIRRARIEELTYQDYKDMLDHCKNKDKNSLLIDKDIPQMFSISNMLKQEKDLSYYELRDKRMNLNTPDKRIMDYENNTSEAYFFETLEDFLNFEFPKTLWEVEEVEDND